MSKAAYASIKIKLQIGKPFENMQISSPLAAHLKALGRVYYSTFIRFVSYLGKMLSCRTRKF